MGTVPLCPLWLFIPLVGSVKAPSSMMNTEPSRASTKPFEIKLRYERVNDRPRFFRLGGRDLAAVDARRPEGIFRDTLRGCGRPTREGQE